MEQDLGDPGSLVLRVLEQIPLHLGNPKAGEGEEGADGGAPQRDEEL